MNFSFGKKRIYADWAATTPLRNEVKKAMDKARKVWANPSAIYKEGVEAHKALEKARADGALVLGVKPEEIYFTSGGTEANATIIAGVLNTWLDKGRRDVHVVTSAIEHSSILENLKLFESRGVSVTYVSPDKNGVVQAEDILKAITPATVLVTCMYANNEIGTIQPISKIGSGIRKMRAEKVGKIGQGEVREEISLPVFHTDASQVPLWLSCELEGLRADAMTLDAHKMQGPKGVGALVVRRNILWKPLLIGGGQERGQRSTTESLELITGFTTALAIAQREREQKFKSAEKIQKYFFKKIASEIPKAIINGSLEKRLPNNVNISLPNISDPEMAVLQLDKAGIACSTKSSCLKGEESSYVIKVIALSNENSENNIHWRTKNTLRFTFSPNTNLKDINRIIESLKMLK